MRAPTSSFRSILRHSAVLTCSVSLALLTGCGSDDEEDADADASDLSFFVTSTTHDGDLGGLTGADAECDALATAVDAGDKTWRAYLSAENGGTPIHAKDRIGDGPWFNADGAKLADTLTELLALSGDSDLFIDENGDKINGQWNGSNGMGGSAANEHDIITGSDTTGSLVMSDTQSTCSDWTSNTLTPGPQVGHTDGMGPGMSTTNTMGLNYTSWNGGHAAVGCSAGDLAMRGSAGRFYCFATN